MSQTSIGLRAGLAFVLDSYGFPHAAAAIRIEGAPPVLPAELVAAWDTWARSGGDCFHDPLFANKAYRAPRRLRGRPRHGGLS